ncbi:MAG: hypothetical protein IRY90_20100, partial [Actinomadura rubrobrunea]|nr:hypothetical protein [Actinomadura rubrobrunea]
LVPEPPGGAPADHAHAAALLGAAIRRHLAELAALRPDELLARRRRRLRASGATAVRTEAEREGIGV